jgi:hypothetical protein
MPDALPHIGADSPPGSGQALPDSPAQPGRVLQMKPAEGTPETLDERISEVIHEVQNGGSGWQGLERQAAETWQEISSEARSLFQNLSFQARRLCEERPIYVIGVVTITAFFLGAVLRATRSRYD